MQIPFKIQHLQNHKLIFFWRQNILDLQVNVFQWRAVRAPLFAKILRYWRVVPELVPDGVSFCMHTSSWQLSASYRALSAPPATLVSATPARPAYASVHPSPAKGYSLPPAATRRHWHTHVSSSSSSISSSASHFLISWF